MDKDGLKTTIQKFWSENESKIILVFGFILVAILSFEAGIIQGRKTPANPVIIEKPAEIRVSADQADSGVPEAPKSLQELQNSSGSPTATNQKCLYVGSKNSNKYHLPTCRWAKNIKPENIVCFSSAEEAAGRNYLPDKNCIK